jgi:hypothetical protein
MMLNDMCVVLIGVDDYSLYDRTSHSSGHNLPGSVNDVRAWLKICMALGVDPKNVRIFASPLPDASEFPADVGCLKPATYQNILDGAHWLATMLGGPESTRTGLLTYSGHGDIETRKTSSAGTVHLEFNDVALCPTDVAVNDEAVNEEERILRRIPSRELMTQLNTTTAPLPNLTMVLDCCYSGDAQGLVASLSLGTAPGSL